MLISLLFFQFSLTSPRRHGEYTTRSDQAVPPQQAVRFSSVNQEISPYSEPSQDDESLRLVNTVPSPDSSRSVTEEQIQQLKDSSISLQKSHIQSARMDQFIFDPISLPPSRVSRMWTSNVVANI